MSSVVPEARGQVDRDVLVPLLKAVVLADVMQVVASDNDGPLHLHFGHHTCRSHAEFKYNCQSASPRLR